MSDLSDSAHGGPGIECHGMALLRACVTGRKRSV